MLYTNKKGNFISVSWKLWLRTCIGDNTHAFVIDVKDKDRKEELLEKVSDLFDELYPTVRYIKHFPAVLKLDRDNFSGPTGYVVKDRFLSYVITRKDIEILLRRITKEDVFEIQDVRNYVASDNTYLLTHPTGCPWAVQSSF